MKPRTSTFDNEPVTSRYDVNAPLLATNSYTAVLLFRLAPISATPVGDCTCPSGPTMIPLVFDTKIAGAAPPPDPPTMSAVPISLPKICAGLPEASMFSTAALVTVPDYVH